MIIELYKRSDGELHIGHTGEVTITGCNENMAVSFKSLQNEKIAELKFWAFGLLNVVTKDGREITINLDFDKLPPDAVKISPSWISEEEKV